MAAVRSMKLLILLAPLLQSWAVQPRELEDWLTSAKGFSLSREEASTLAAEKWSTLTQCGVNIKTLQSLKDVMYDKDGMDLSAPELRKNLMWMAEQHVSSVKLRKLYQALSGGYTISGGLALPKSEAQWMAMDLAAKSVEPDQLKELYKVMYGYAGLGFAQKDAQETAIAQAIAFANATSFQETYLQAIARGATKEEAIKIAGSTAVNNNLGGLVRRYAKDAKPYTSLKFQQFYPETWYAEWIAGPLEQKVSNDRKAYTASQYSRHFRYKDWMATYTGHTEATQMRLASDGKAYSMWDYQKQYNDEWQSKWAASPELACAECGAVGRSEL